MPDAWISFKSGSEATTAVAGGHTQFTPENLSEMLGLVEGKKLRVLAVSGEQRLPAVPDAPTMKEGMTNWTQKHVDWVRRQDFEHPAHRATFQDYMHEVDHAMDRITRLEAAIEEVLPSLPPEVAAVVAGLQALRGIGCLSAATIVAEVGPLSRFEHPRKLMGYSGTVSSEHSSGRSTWRGPITKAGNAHLRRAVVEAAWGYRHAPAMSRRLLRRQKGLDAEVKEIAWKAQCRLSARFRKLTGKGKPCQKAVTAVARELLGFIWSIGTHVERKQRTLPAAS